MKTDAEINDDAVGQCPYSAIYTGHSPWVEGYKTAARQYEQQLERLRGLLRKMERRAEEC